MLLSRANFKALTGWAQTVVIQSSIKSPTSLNIPGWTFGAQDGGSLTLSSDASLNYNNEAGSLVGSYPSSPRTGGGVFAWGAYNLAPLETEDIYVELWAKMPGSKQGLKFPRIFGVSSASGNCANTIFALDYTGGDPGAMYQVSFGDGSSVGSDTTKSSISVGGTRAGSAARMAKRMYRRPRKGVFLRRIGGPAGITSVSTASSTVARPRRPKLTTVRIMSRSMTRCM
jgi:hypothetical protein